MTVLDEAKDVLNKFIERSGIEFDTSDGYENELEFFAKYYILKTSTKPNELLKECHILSKGCDDYFKREDRKNLKKSFESLYKRFYSVKKRNGGDNHDSEQEKAEQERIERLKFLKWWTEQEKKCYYCGIDEGTTKDLFDKEVIHSKKRSFNGSLQIDKKDSSKGYTPENCVFACVLCNNAKSDMISATDFSIIAKGIGE